MPKNPASEASEPKRIGRDTIFTQDLADEICERLYESDGDELPESLRKICRDDRMPHISTVCRWLTEPDKKSFKEQYVRARELRRDALIDRIFTLSGDAIKNAYGSPGTGEAGARVNAIKLEIDTIKWILSKEYPREYGELIKQEVSGPEGQPLQSAMSLTPEILSQITHAASLANNLTPPPAIQNPE